MQQLDQLELPKHDRARFEAAIEAKVPRLTRREYDEWLVRRVGLGLKPGKPPGFKVCGEKERK